MQSHYNAVMEVMYHFSNTMCFLVNSRASPFVLNLGTLLGKDDTSFAHVVPSNSGKIPRNDAIDGVISLFRYPQQQENDCNGSSS